MHVLYTAFIQLFKLSTNSKDQNEGDIDPQRFARLLSAIMVITGLLILVIGEPCGTAFALCIPISVARYPTFLHDPGGPPARFLPSSTQLHCRYDIHLRSRSKHGFHGVIY